MMPFYWTTKEIWTFIGAFVALIAFSQYQNWFTGIATVVLTFWYMALVLNHDGEADDRRYALEQKKKAVRMAMKKSGVGVEA